MELVTAAVAFGRISMFSGVKVQEDSSGRAEQESVTNMGAVSEAAFTGVTEATSVPVWPGVRVSVTGAMEIPKLGTELTSAVTCCGRETEPE
jgi:hydrogenase maturation factor HypE